MKKMVLFLAGLCMMLAMEAQVSKTVDVNAGGLYNALSPEERSTVTNLTVSGTIDTRDFKTMRDFMPLLADINLNGVTIQAYTGKGGTRDTVTISYPSNTIPDYSFYNPFTFKGKTGLVKIVIPSTVVSIGISAFESSTGLTSVNFPVSLTTIQKSAFAYCSKLTSIELPSSVNNVHEAAFKFCTSLTSAVFPSSITTLETSVMAYCVKLTSFNVPSSVSIIGEKAFENCTALKSVTFPSSVTAIRSMAFNNCQVLSNVTLPSSLQTIGDYAFQFCPAIVTINIPATVSSIGTGAFRGTDIALTVDAANPWFIISDGVLYNISKTNLIYCPVSKRGSFTIPASVTALSGSAFYQCTGLTSVNIPAALTAIGSYAFAYCSGLISISIPGGVTSIETNAFYNCTKIRTINAYPRNPVDLSAQINVFYGISKTTATLNVPYGTKSLYQAANQWKDFLNITELSGFILSSNTIVLGAAQGSSASVTLSANVSWKAASDQSWLTVNPTSGNNTSTINLTATANTGNTVRMAEVAFSSSGIDTLFLTVYQRTTSDITSEISLVSGWNIGSINSLPIIPDIKHIFQPLIDDGSLVKVQDENGNALEDLGVFGGWTNNIGNAGPSEGYKIKVIRPVQLVVQGTPVAFPYKIFLRAGWNMVGFPRQSAADALEVVQQLINRGTLVKVQDEAGNAIEDFGVFGGWRNFIGNFRPGDGYKIKVSANDTLTIYESYTKSLASLPSTPATSHFRNVKTGNGVDHMNINLVGLPAGQLQAGDEIGVFDGNQCTGAVKLTGKNLSDRMVTIAATAEDGLGDKGFIEGHPIILRIWKESGNREIQPEPDVIRGTTYFKKLESTFYNLEKTIITEINDPSLTREILIYPNPAAGKVYIGLSNRGNKHIGIVYISVINSQGQEILKKAAENNVTVIDLSEKAKGVYCIRISGEYWTKTEKLILR